MQFPLIEMAGDQPDKEKDDSIKTFASHLLSISHIITLPGPLSDSIRGEALSLTEENSLEISRENLNYLIFQTVFSGLFLKIFG